MFDRKGFRGSGAELRRAPNGALEVVVPSSAEMAGLRAAYAAAQWVPLPGFLSGDLLEDVVEGVEAARFMQSEKPGVRPEGSETRAQDGEQ